METKKINFDYLSIYKEIIFSLALVFSNKKTQKPSNRILIITPCLVGEFMAFLPALHDFIMKHKNQPIDLVVSPGLQPLAERIIGIDRVFTTKSVYGREQETAVQNARPHEHYYQKIILRISQESYTLARDILSEKTEINLKHFVKYGFHLFKNIVLRRAPKQWSQVNFEMLGGVPKFFKFDEIFKFKEEDYTKLKQWDFLKTSQKRIIVHTNCNWPMKKWSNNKWAELLKKVNKLDEFEFIFVGAKEDEADYTYISSKLDFKTHSLIGETDLAELMLVLRASDYFLGIDSGPQNMAQLAGMKSVIIFGPGPHMHLPWNGKSIAIDKSGGRGIYQTFFLKKNNFISKVKVEEVFDAFCKVHSQFFK